MADRRPSKGPPIPIPAGGFQTNEQEARWLADTIDMRAAEAIERTIGVKVSSPSNGLYDLILLCMQSAAKRATDARKPDNAAERARLEQELALVRYQRQELLMAMKRIEHCSMFVPAGTTSASVLAAIQSHATQTIALATEKVAALDAADE